MGNCFAADAEPYQEPTEVPKAEAPPPPRPASPAPAPAEPDDGDVPELPAPAVSGTDAGAGGGVAGVGSRVDGGGTGAPAAGGAWSHGPPSSVEGGTAGGDASGDDSGATAGGADGAGTSDGPPPPSAVAEADAGADADTETGAEVGSGGGGGSGADATADADGGGRERVLFFPDKAMPCRNFHDPRRTCRRGHECTYMHGGSNLIELQQLLRSARRSLDVCVFSITCNELADEIEAAHQRGVAVRVITDDDQAEAKGSDVQSLSGKGVPVRTDHSEAHMHHKACVIDGATLVNGSFNWTRSAVVSNRENIAVITSPSIVAAFTREFEVLWELFGPTADASTPVRSAASVDCGGGQRVLFFPDAKPPCRWYYDPEKTCRRGDGCQYAHGDSAAQELIEALGAAETSIDLCVFNLTNNDLARALEGAHDRGVAVRIITDNDQSESRGSDVKDLASKGIVVRTDDSPAHMHNKYAVIDGATTLSGSFNYTRGAVLENRENIVISRSPALATQFSAEFDKLWRLFEANAL